MLFSTINKFFLYIHKNGSVLLRLLPIFWGNDRKVHLRFILAGLFVGLTILFNLGVPLTLRWVVDSLEQANVAWLLMGGVLFSYVFIWMSSQHKTSLIITHKLNDVVNADNIYVLRQGEIVEQGTHQELLARQDYYYKLYMIQQRGSIQ